MSIVYKSQTQIIRDDCEFLKPIPRVHQQRLTIQHWQLRDLITCPKTSEEFIYVNQNAVNAYNTRTKATTQLMKDLTFHPTSLTASCGYLAAGGQRSQLMVRQMNSNWFAHTSVGGSINNALCISEHLGGTRLLISNNDETIKVYSLPGLQRLANIQLPTAVNYGGYQKIGTYTATTEASFSEHVSYVNLVDARTFHDRQVIRVAPPGNDEHISGIAMSPDSKVCFVGLENSVLEFDVDTITRRSFPSGSLI
ncbi:hypothetical protein KI688_001997 [Linnemannia hyalina]|uniref:DUF2415 domain-containing protein n=1 Tax=Linnemannia hyalina TaxID=64524 RepID=A0A9P8BRX9_9FUNG|nr:hypothetical protein KI688_001997 [Linnemannia hyalina]